MKGFFYVITLAFLMSSFAADISPVNDSITLPILSLRCRELFQERNDKIKIQQRLNGLLQRNESLIQKTHHSKESLKAKLQSTQVKIKNELYLTNLQIEKMAENIIRSGCPGISL